MSSLIDLTGKKFGRLTILRRHHTKRRQDILWLCHCSCGNKTLATSGDLKRRSGNKSCGCAKIERAIALGKASTTHHMSTSPEYRIWQGMKQRCYNPNEPTNVKCYQNQGVVICQRWLHSFEAFYADLGPRPKGASIDRYPNPAGNYEPTNCRWATPKEQRHNQTPHRRAVRMITFHGKTRHIKEWCEITGIPHAVLTYRIIAGWPIRQALETPVRPYVTRHG